MDTAYCARKAEECEFRAAEETTPELRREWLRMAGEWRLTPSTTQPDGAPPAAHPDGA
jgi:hypothetical protein